MIRIVVAIALLHILIGDGVLGSDERSAKEKRCDKRAPKPFGNIDNNWIQSVDTWYITHGSRLDIYRVASDVTKTPVGEIHEDDLYYRGCMTVNWEGDRARVSGFHGKTAEANIKEHPPGVFKKRHANYEIDGTGVLILTDNKTFRFFYKCYDDGEASWVVLSTVADLDKKTENLIHEHARSLGFNEDNFTEMEFEQCGEVSNFNAQKVEL